MARLLRVEPRVVQAASGGEHVPLTGQEQTSFLAEISVLLGSPLETERMLSRVSRLAVPLLGDLCAVDLQDADGAIRRAACAHLDPTKEGVAYEARARYGFRAEAPNGIHGVLRSGRSALVSPATSTDLAQAAQNDEQLELFRQLGVTSWMVVPMVVRERTLGAITLAITESDRRYASSDLLFAEAVARQVALAGHNARLQRDADAARAAVQIILRNVKAQVRLVDDLLDVSRVASGKLRLNVQPVDLRRVVEDAVDGIRPAADAKGIRLQSVLASPGGPVSGDPDRLQQVLWNLVSNAVKFTPKGGRVQIQLQRGNSHVELIVTDTGQGIEPAVLPYVFDRFRQGDATSTRAHGGLGLGLALVRSLVELHGGSVLAESPGGGQGATFVVKLPLMIANLAAPAAGKPDPLERAGAPVAGISLAGVHILVVDDDPTAVELNREILLQAGGEVRGSATGREALEVLGQWRPDVIVSDIEMPGIDGYSLIRQVRALDPEQGGKTPAVALSAYSRPEDRVRSLMAGFNLHVSKPVEPSELTTIVASLAGRVG